MTDSLAYIQICAPHIECEILKAISEESVGWTKAILIDNLKERAIEFCNSILFLESNHGCLFTPTMLFKSSLHGLTSNFPLSIRHYCFSSFLANSR